MLFFAVFLGFIAEYQLEHRIEKEKGTQYLKSMIVDIALDSAKINKVLEVTEVQVKGLDSLTDLLNTLAYDESSLKQIYSLNRKYCGTFYTVNFTKRTLNQLFNAGGLRLLPNNGSVNFITEYQELCAECEDQGKFYDNSLDYSARIGYKIFYSDFSLNPAAGKVDSLMKGKKIELLTNDKQELMEYCNSLKDFSAILKNYNSMLRNIRVKIPNVIESLKEINDIE